MFITWCNSVVGMRHEVVRVGGIRSRPEQGQGPQNPRARLNIMNKSKYAVSKSPGRNKERKIRKKSSRTKKDIICATVKPNISSFEPYEDYQPSAGLFGEQDIEGKEVFKVTPLKHKSIKTSNGNVSEGLPDVTTAFPKAETPKRSSSHPRMKQEPVSTGKLSRQLSNISLASPLAKSLHKQRTNLDVAKKLPRRSLNAGFTSPEAETPIQQRSSKRQGIKRELANLRILSLESDPEDSDESVSSEDLENEIPGHRKSIQEKQNTSKTFPETYFLAQKQKKMTTSNRTLSSLKLERTDINELQKILKNVPDHHKKEKEALFKHYQSLFPKWKFMLHEGFNVLLYGVGSKLKIMNSFCKECLSGALYVTINGFFPSLTLKQVLTSITEEALGYEGKFSSNYEHAEYIRKYFLEENDELYLIFHNLDGMFLRHVKTQMLLASLAAIPNIHFVASIDHINAPLMWDQIMLSQFRWVWFDVTTFDPYVLETSYEDSIFKDKSSHLLLSSLLNVYHGLNSNGQGVFKILAKHQFEQRENSFLGISFHEWYQECREDFLVNSEVTMQAQLSEFKNHKLLNSRKSIEGCELWYIPVDVVTLEQFLGCCK
ncbi:origin recognition complex subunit 2 [Nephila pilipes]|uniref:Origin recognition complex subunit 2 n=1 Tax=Nephila pilipes TaxID=299642 RepID=A0A8X6QDU8_NEPPI|nr:origin recognition complex subunit 2 [Nephila pilipes]